ncbi:MAG: DUF308 domain-containing protein [Thermomicrobiales bacterium]
MAEQAFSMASEHAPWRAGTPWWVTGAQGVLLVAIGLYLLLAPASAAGLIIQLIALILLVESVLHIIAQLRAEEGAGDRYTLLQAGIGATVGVLLVLRGMLLPSLDALSARNMLAFGLIAYALVGVAGALIGRDDGDSWLRPIVNALLLVILAIVLLTSGETNAANRLGVLGWIALIGGAVLLFLAWRSRQAEQAH